MPDDAIADLAAGVDDPGTGEIANRQLYGSVRWQQIKRSQDRRDDGITAYWRARACWYLAIAVLAGALAIAVLVLAALALVRWA